MLGRCCAGWAAFSLTGCALISGPCVLEHGFVACERGGVIVLLLPAPTIKASGEAMVAVREAKVPWQQMRPHEGP